MIGSCVYAVQLGLWFCCVAEGMLNNALLDAVAFVIINVLLSVKLKLWLSRLLRL